MYTYINIYVHVCYPSILTKTQDHHGFMNFIISWRTYELNPNRNRNHGQFDVRNNLNCCFQRKTSLHRGYRDSARLLGDSWTKKMMGHSGDKIAQKSRNIFSDLSFFFCSFKHRAQFFRILEPNTNAQRMSFYVTSIALSCAHICARLLKPLAHSLIGSPGTLVARIKLSGCTRGLYLKKNIYIYIYKSASCRSIQQSKTFCSSLDLVSLPLSLSLSLMLLLWSHPKFPIPFVSKNCSSACLRVHSVLEDLVIISRLLVLFSVTKRNDNSITLTPPFLGPDTLTPPFLSLDHCQSL